MKPIPLLLAGICIAMSIAPGSVAMSQNLSYATASTRSPIVVGVSDGVTDGCWNNREAVEEAVINMFARFQLDAIRSEEFAATPNQDPLFFRIETVGGRAGDICAVAHTVRLTFVALTQTGETSSYEIIWVDDEFGLVTRSTNADEALLEIISNFAAQVAIALQQTRLANQPD